MKAAIARLGRVVVPKPIREKLRLTGGEILDVQERDGVIELRPAATEVAVIDTPEGPVAVPVVDGPPLTDELVREVLDQARR